MCSPCQGLPNVRKPHGPDPGVVGQVDALDATPEREGLAELLEVLISQPNTGHDDLSQRSVLHNVLGNREAVRPAHVLDPCEPARAGRCTGVSQEPPGAARSNNTVRCCRDAQEGKESRLTAEIEDVWRGVGAGVDLLLESVENLGERLDL